MHACKISPTAIVKISSISCLIYKTLESISG